jgi:hypothetical protein
MQSVFGLHDRNAFDVTCYALRLGLGLGLGFVSLDTNLRLGLRSVLKAFLFLCHRSVGL